MLYLILFGVIIFLVLKLQKKAPISEQQIIDKVFRQLDERERSTPPQPRTVEPIIVVDKTPPEPPKVEPSSVAKASDEPLPTEEKEETDEEIAELAKKPLEEVIKGKLRKSRPLSMNEQPMFTKLRTTLEPEYVVLAQVSFGAILWTWSHGVRNRFNRKIVDFVVCDKGFNVIAVVELDDSSHKGKEERDAERDLLLNEAGITVLRYKFTPESSKILEDIKAIPQ